MTGALFYRGPSLLTGDEILAIATGLQVPSRNRKTGPMVQIWILRADRAPMQAARDNVDDAVCGDCKLRGRDGFGRVCFVTLWQGPLMVWKARDRYPVTTPHDLARDLAGRHVRITAYGDPAAVPASIWPELVCQAAGWTAYTHQWRHADPRLAELCMASVETVEERDAAAAAGWRTFRNRHASDALGAGEVVCPASDEGGAVTVCQACELCQGQAKPARSVAIQVHGRRMAFYTSAVAGQVVRLRAVGLTGDIPSR